MTPPLPQRPIGVKDLLRNVFEVDAAVLWWASYSYKLAVEFNETDSFYILVILELDEEDQ